MLSQPNSCQPSPEARSTYIIALALAPDNLRIPPNVETPNLPPQIPLNLETPNLPPQVPVPEGEPGLPGPGPAITPSMEALQVTLGQFMGTMNEMVGRLAEREGHPQRNGAGRPPGDVQGEAPEMLEGLRRRLAAETPRRKPVDPKKYDGEGCPWEDYLLKFELIADWNRWDEEERAEALLMSLDGDAAGYVQDLRGFRNFSYTEICAALND